MPIDHVHQSFQACGLPNVRTKWIYFICMPRVSKKIIISGPYFKIRTFHIKFQISSLSWGMENMALLGCILAGCLLERMSQWLLTLERYSLGQELLTYNTLFFHSQNASCICLTCLALLTTKIIANTFTKHTIFQTLPHSISITVLREKCYYCSLPS